MLDAEMPCFWSKGFPTDGRRWVAIDAGPLRYKPQKGGDSRIGPYAGYFVSAAQEVWANAGMLGPFTPAAMINSHQHDDHLGSMEAIVGFAKRNNNNGRVRLEDTFKVFMPNIRPKEKEPELGI